MGLGRGEGKSEHNAHKILKELTFKKINIVTIKLKENRKRKKNKNKQNFRE